MTGAGYDNSVGVRVRAKMRARKGHLVSNWVWSALSGAVLMADWSFGSWLIKFKVLTSPPVRWNRARIIEVAAAFIFVGIAIAQYLGGGR